MVDYSLLGTIPDAGKGFMNGYTQSRDMLRQEDGRNALLKYVKTPTTDSFNALLAVDPQLASSVQSARAGFDDTQRTADARNALSNYMRSSTRAAPPRQVSPAPAANSVASPGALDLPRGSPLDPNRAANRSPAGNVPEAATDAAVSSVPSIFVDQDHNGAWQRLIDADPGTAMKVRASEAKELTDRLATMNDAMAFAVQNLANVGDDASYQQVVGEFVRQLGPMGESIAQMLPPQYPGPEGIRSLLLRGAEVQQQISAMDRKAKLDWDIVDDQVDNNRAASEAGSRDLDRRERRRMTGERDGREASRGNTPRGPRQEARGGPEQTATGPDGHKIVLRGGRWLDAKTGRPVG